jgi:hypothetical protein
MSETTRWMRFHPPGAGWVPSGMGRPAELFGPLSKRRRLPRTTSANAGAALVRSLKSSPPALRRPRSTSSAPPVPGHLGAARAPRSTGSGPTFPCVRLTRSRPTTSGEPRRRRAGCGDPHGGPPLTRVSTRAQALGDLDPGSEPTRCLLTASSRPRSPRRGGGGSGPTGPETGAGHPMAAPRPAARGRCPRSASRCRRAGRGRRDRSGLTVTSSAGCRGTAA